jgi:acid stress chaperone HdeA
MKKILIGLFVVGVVVAQGAQAQTTTKVKPMKMTCEEFVALDDSQKPAVVYYAAGVTSGGMQETDEVMVDTATPVATVVEECKKTPKMKFLTKFKQLLKSGTVTVNYHQNNP